MSTETSRMLNVGVPVTLNTLGEIKVRELSVEALLTLSPHLATVLQVVSTKRSDASGTSTGDGEGVKMLIDVLSNPATSRLLKEVAALSTRLPAESFNELPLTDWLRWLVAFKEVTHWEELKELFHLLIPSGLGGLGGIIKGTTNTTQTP